MSKIDVLGGISDEWTPVVASLNGVAESNPELIDVLLSPDGWLLERRSIDLPLSGNVVLDIVRTEPGAARIIELLEYSVRGVEGFMGLPLPTNHIVVLYEDAVGGGSAGTNYQTNITILQKYDVDEGSGYDAESAGAILAHEVAHYYWSGNAEWVDEGAAEFMASVLESARTGESLRANNEPCAHASNIADLLNLETSNGVYVSDCNYSLGERLFLDLYLEQGDERFRKGFRDLYLTSEIEDDVDDIPGTSVSVAQIESNFGTHEAAIGRWYYGTEPFNLERLDSSVLDPDLPVFNGRIDEAYVAIGQDGPAILEFSASDVTDWVYLTLEYSYDIASGPIEIPLQIVEYYEDGFAFNGWDTELTAEAGYIGGTEWFSVGASPSNRWAPGRYWVYVYANGQKVAEVQYEVTPEKLIGRLWISCHRSLPNRSEGRGTPRWSHSSVRR